MLFTTRTGPPAGRPTPVEEKRKVEHDEELKAALFATVLLFVNQNEGAREELRSLLAASDN